MKYAKTIDVRLHFCLQIQNIVQNFRIIRALEQGGCPWLESAGPAGAAAAFFYCPPWTDGDQTTQLLDTLIQRGNDAAGRKTTPAGRSGRGAVSLGWVASARAGCFAAGRGARCVVGEKGWGRRGSGAGIWLSGGELAQGARRWRRGTADLSGSGQGRLCTGSVGCGEVDDRCWSGAGEGVHRGL